jgi:phospholipase/lecithinase/hemolysin
VYEGLEQQGQLPPNLKVENCDTTSTQTVLSPRVSVQYGFTLIDQAAKNPSQTITLDCGATGTPVLTLPEAEAVAGTVQQYNAIIQQEASDRGFAYLNPNAVLQALYQDLGSTPADPTDDPIPKFPDRDSSEPFGPFFSLDGVHPNDATHRLIANELIKLLNQPEAQGGYGTNLPTLNNVPSVP